MAGAAPAGAATVYKWVDENGVIHYSDQPRPGAQKVEVASPPTFSAPPPRPVASSAAYARPTAAPSAYEACVITSPANDEVFVNAWSVSGQVRVQPQLRTGDQVVLLLNGERVPGATTAGSFTISSIARGTHTLAAAVQDAEGRTLCEAPSVTFHVRQPSRQAPNPANRPRF